MCHRHLRKLVDNSGTDMYLVEYILVFPSASEKWNVNDMWGRLESTTAMFYWIF